MICTFFGHKDTPQNILPVLRTVIIDLIQNKNVDLFYVGNNGNFDFMVKKHFKNFKIKLSPYKIYDCSCLHAKSQK